LDDEVGAHGYKIIVGPDTTYRTGTGLKAENTCEFDDEDDRDIDILGVDITYRFDAYMLDIDDLNIEEGHFRLLEASEALFLPVFQNIRIFVTSDDVIHS
jgi:heme/copper-type cytochrome/quinol oxidase subunit 2